MGQITFANPKLFFLLLLIPAIVAWYWYKQRNNHASVQLSNIAGLLKAPKSWRHYFRHLPFVLRMLVIALLIVVLARPQAVNSGKNVSVEGIDIIVALDISGSMLAQDLSPDRLGAAKKVSKEFINGRPNDRIGMVVFSAESFTQCPLTTDHKVLTNLMEGMQSGMIQDGTAIGLGLATAVNRLKDSKAKSKVIILLTDGVNNAGSVSPSTAAEIAKSFGIRVYTIGVGTRGKAPYPVQTMFGIQMQPMDVQIDEDMLTSVAKLTNGRYFRATDNKSLSDIYSEIDKLEKTKLQEYSYSKRSEEFWKFALAALVLFIAEFVLRHTWLRTLP
jgi:Ca-activated chloride channel homolog